MSGMTHDEMHQAVVEAILLADQHLHSEFQDRAAIVMIVVAPEGDKFKIISNVEDSCRDGLIDEAVARMKNAGPSGVTSL